MFILYKLFTKEILFWKNTAKEQESSRVSCCRLYAALGEQTVYTAYDDFLADDNQYDWFKNAVMGNPPPQIKVLSEDEVRTRLRTMKEGYPSLNENITPRSHGYRKYDRNIDWAKKT